MAKISVYLENGNVHEYDVGLGEAVAREHANAIIQTGYRSVTEDAPDIFTYWPPHQIKKVKVKLDENSTTKYFDNVRGT